MIIQQAIGPDGQQTQFNIEQPHECPICFHAIEPRQSNAFFCFDDKGQPSFLEVVFRCPNQGCLHAFIARYENAAPGEQPTRWNLKICVPVTFRGREFDDGVKKISENFIGIYNQAEQAEARGLDQICGQGYQMSLEFLIKDYVKTFPANETKGEEIEKTLLGPCISRFVTDPNVKACASRATCLGNDETHYLRKWEDKDIRDLKRLISLTIYWVSSEILIHELKNAMPERGPASAEGKAAGV